MKLIDQHTKKIMEGCKERARDFGLEFDNETLEYIVTNRDLTELSPKMMIPTMYDYWVHDLEILKGMGEYELYPYNPYETVINTRPAVSFYNDNNPDWLNTMIFYHVLAHIDFFQNNIFFSKTWDYDFVQQALSDKRIISSLKSKHGRWVDYIIEFTRGINNLVGYFDDLATKHTDIERSKVDKKIDYYFDVFLQSDDVKLDYIEEIERFNTTKNIDLFFIDVSVKYPEFEALFENFLEEDQKNVKTNDLIQYLLEYSPFLNEKQNRWMKDVITIVRNTSIYFGPQIITKIANEGWSSYVHEMLFMQDDRMKGHEVDFARVNSGVVALPKVGLNPYAIGMRLYEYIRELGDKGRYSREFMSLLDEEGRKSFNKKTSNGKDLIFKIRKNLSDFQLLNTYITDDFMKKYDLCVVGARINKDRGTIEYYIKSRKLKDYKDQILDYLPHPPCIEINPHGCVKAKGSLYLNHVFEGKQLVTPYIHNVMLGINHLWGGNVLLETSEIRKINLDETQTNLPPLWRAMMTTKAIEENNKDITWDRIIYTMSEKKLARRKK